MSLPTALTALATSELTLATWCTRTLSWVEAA